MIRFGMELVGKPTLSQSCCDLSSERSYKTLVHTLGASSRPSEAASPDDADSHQLFLR